MDKQEINVRRGKQILEVLDRLGLTQNQFARIIGKSRQYVNMVVQGARQLKLTDEQVLRLAEETGEDEEFWLRLGLGEFPREVAQDKERLERQWAEIGPRILTDAEIEQAVELDYLVIDPFDPELLCPTKMYCTIASKALVRAKDDCAVINLDDGWELKRDEFLTVRSEQYFKLPGRITAELGQVAENVRSGITVHHGLGIDPTWEGSLICRLENKGSFPVTIQTGMKLLSARFEFVARKPRRVYQPVPHDEVEAGFAEVDLRTAGRQPGGRAAVERPAGAGGGRGSVSPAAQDDFENAVMEFMRAQQESMEANTRLTAELAALLKERRGGSE